MSTPPQTPTPSRRSSPLPSSRGCGPRQRSVWQRYWPLVALVLVLLLVHYLAGVLAPFIASIILAYILEPLVTRMARLGLSRNLSSLIVLSGTMLVVLALTLVIVPMFAQQLSALYGYLPKLLLWLRETAAPWLESRLGIDVAFDLDHLKEWLAEHGGEAGRVLTAMLPSLTSGGMALVEFSTSLVLIPVVLFYYLRDWPAMLHRVERLAPPRWKVKLHEVMRDLDAVLGQFLRGQVAVMLIMAVFYSLGLWMTGLKSALPIGIVAGLLIFVPYLGATVGLLLGTLAGLLQFQSLGGLLPIWAVFTLGQLIESFYVTPRLVGERIGLHPVTVIFALMAFGKLFGFVGVLLALPMAAALVVGFRHLQPLYFASRWYRR
ncbi:AI-2E family transporter [Chitinimonas lacunae]|uniref:AI-2E family transporter n=1 Tax=Chitinimonas lacunae TaxID=1963018 RepID=A0ABV8MSS2_9NEIS